MICFFVPYSAFAKCVAAAHEYSRNPRMFAASLFPPKPTMSRKSEPKTKGTVISDKNRKKANTLSAAERHELMGKALELIYRV